MARTYTYDPEKILENGLDRMRFELGDIMVEGREATAALADEEIRAALSLYSGEGELETGQAVTGGKRLQAVCVRSGY